MTSPAPVEICPDCGGDGAYERIITMYGDEIATLTCPRCHGTGARPEIEDGQEWDGTCDRGGRLPMAGDTGWPRPP